MRPVPNVMLLPCRTQMKLSFRFKHGSSTPFETIKRGTADSGVLSGADIQKSRSSDIVMLAGKYGILDKKLARN